MDRIVFKVLCLLLVFIVDCSSNIHYQKYHREQDSSSRKQPPSPFDQSYQMIILTGGKVYGVPNKNATTKVHVNEPQEIDIVISSGKILALMEPSKTSSFISFMKDQNWQILSVNVRDQLVIPGLIDPHIHAIGGGGEQGPYSRTAESRLSELINGGLTTVVGILGTDGIARSPAALFQKMKGLEYDGLSTWMWVGSYRIPIVTLTGSFQEDLLFIDKVLGAGELALSDHRSSWPSKADLLQLLSDVRVNGMLSGKSGIIHFHMGSSPTKLDLLWQILNETTIPIRHMYPTHMTSRGEALIAEAKKWLVAGGNCDFTADFEQLNETDTVETLNKFRSEKLPLQQITVSSDAYGSVPVYDDAGHLISYGMAPPDLSLKTIQTLVMKYKWPLEEAIQFSTSNPAVYLNLNGKGFLTENYDADIVVLNKTDLTPLYVFGKGQVLKTPSWTKHDITQSLDISYNQLRLPACPHWNINGIAFADTSTLGIFSEVLFVDKNNIIYVVDPAYAHVKEWHADSTTITGITFHGLRDSRSLFVTDDGTIYADTGRNNQIEKWTLNATESIVVMYTDSSCHGLFVDIMNNIYCSSYYESRVVKQPLDIAEADRTSSETFSIFGYLVECLRSY